MPLSMFEASLLATDVELNPSDPYVNEFNGKDDGNRNTKTALALYIMASGAKRLPESKSWEVPSELLSSIFLIGVITGILMERSKHEPNNS